MFAFHSSKTNTVGVITTIVSTDRRRIFVVNEKEVSVFTDSPESGLEKGRWNRGVFEITEKAVDLEVTLNGSE